MRLEPVNCLIFLRPLATGSLLGDTKKAECLALTVPRRLPEEVLGSLQMLHTCCLHPKFSMVSRDSTGFNMFAQATVQLSCFRSVALAGNWCGVPSLCYPSMPHFLIFSLALERDKPWLGYDEISVPHQSPHSFNLRRKYGFVSHCMHYSFCGCKLQSGRGRRIVGQKHETIPLLL